jgi:hypothetical protein
LIILSRLVEIAKGDQVKLIKTFSVALAAVSAMAFVGTASALAEGSTAACRANETPCSAENLYTGHAEGAATNVILLTNLTNVACSESHILGNILGLSNPAIGHLELFTFTSCKTSSGTPCTVKTISLGLIEVLRTGENLGIGTSNGGTEERVTCGFIIDCVYGGKPTLHIEGGEHPTLEANGSLLLGTGGSVCPEQAELDALYELVLPETLYISS